MKCYAQLILAPSVLLCGCAESNFIARDTRKEVVSDRSQLNSEETFSVPDPQTQIDPTPLKSLSADKAGEIALSHNAQFRADLAALGIAEADIKEAGLLRNPRIDLLTGMDEKPFEFLLSFPSEVIWQRPFREEFADAAYQQLAEGLIQNGLDVIRDAKLLHTDVLLTEKKAQLAADAVHLLSEISELTELRLRAGDITELESLAARLEVNAAIEQESRLRHDHKVALERLKNGLGLSPFLTDIQLIPSEPDLTAPPNLSDLVDRASARRPDLRASELTIRTALKKVDWEKSRFLNLFSLLFSMKEVGTRGLLASPGVTFEIPIFNRNQGQISRAEAEVEQAIQRYFAVKQRVGFEIAESRAQLVQALETYRINREKVIDAARRAKGQALEQYNKGEVSYLFVLQQSRAVVEAEMRSADLQAAILKSRAQLERNLGGA